MTVQPRQVRDALDALDYPADKDEIVAHATNVGAGEPVLRLLRAIPVAVYDNREQVLSAVPFDRETTDDQTMYRKVYQRRHHTSPQLAEHEKETEAPPIEQELGHNRKE